MSAPEFVVNVTGSLGKRRIKVHQPACRWAKKAGRFYVISPAELVRLADRIERGDAGGAALCKKCAPLAVAGLVVDGT